MIHAYEVEVAKVVGIKEAVLLYNIDFWIQKNIANKTNYYDGMYWTYNSMKAYAELFPELSEKSVRTAIKNLVNNGYLVTGNYNKSAYDRTQWYALTDKYYTICPNSQLHSTERANGSDRTGEPIPDINTGNKPNNTNLNDVADNFFDKLWSMYPKKRGKSSVKPATRKKLLLVGEEEMIRAVKRYADECKGKDIQYVMNGSTFFNGRYEDYLGDDYKPIPQANSVPSNKPYVPEPPKYRRFEKDEHIDAVPMPEELRKKKEQLLRGMSI